MHSNGHLCMPPCPQAVYYSHFGRSLFALQKDKFQIDHINKVFLMSPVCIQLNDQIDPIEVYRYRSTTVDANARQVGKVRI